ncbi:MAG TPA: glycosyl hydrolase [Solirubrobacteraceae bacterium]|nr:glycosyl hydrolase [Solirubrobacteraceae bacterium]
MTYMVHRLSKFLLPLTCACALLATALPASAAAKLTVGISDQNAGMFSQSRFQSLNLTVARYFVPFDAAVTRNKSVLNGARAWINAALSDGVQPMISFGGDGNIVPTPSQYGKAIKAFIKDFPKVKTYAAWNEPDWVYRPKLANNPRLAASYFNALVQNCRGCTDVAGEVYLPTYRVPGGRYTLASYLRAYMSGLHYKPKVWALHNYYDVRSHTTSQVRTMQSVINRGSQIWLTEIAGIERRGHWQYRNQSTIAAGRDEAFLFSIPKKFPNVTRIYHYQWQGTVDGPSTGWDSGLIGPGGVPRPAFYTVAKAAGPRPHHTVRHATRR